ncbi:hypothetical protein MMUC44124_05900 [Mycolicibacterium mucogenicum DSM 44124]|nr:hypothetical protein MMUC44124_05900 [Mycolicibacterium mucogenicum DSM 44124]
MPAGRRARLPRRLPAGVPRPPRHADGVRFTDLADGDRRFCTVRRSDHRAPAFGPPRRTRAHRHPDHRRRAGA